MNRLKEKYIKEVIPEMKKEFNFSNNFEVPKLTKVTLNVGLSKGLKDSNYIEHVEKVLSRISGQKTIRTKAKKSISNFKIREGMEVGVCVNIRGERMYDFIDKLISITFPRVRDFRGIPKDKVDAQGNLNVGFKEYISFPEISSDEVESVFGLELAVTTTAKNKKEGLKLFELLGFPFEK